MGDPARTFGIQYDDTVLFHRFRNYERRLAFGVVDALKKAALRVQQAEFGLVRSEFTIRRPDFFFGAPGHPGGAAARISSFPSVPHGRLFAEISLSPSSQASKRNTLLPLFQTGGERDPFTPGARDVAVPLTGRAARPSFSESVPQAFTFQGLHFKAYRRGVVQKRRRRGGAVPLTLFGEFGRLMHEQLQLHGVQWKGDQRTFILSHSANTRAGGVFERFGKGRGDIREIYSFVPPFHLKERLHWLELADQVAPLWLHEEMQRAAIDVIQHDAGKSA